MRRAAGVDSERLEDGVREPHLVNIGGDRVCKMNVGYAVVGSAYAKKKTWLRNCGGTPHAGQKNYADARGSKGEKEKSGPDRTLAWGNS